MYSPPNTEEDDSLWRDAIALVVENRKASTSLLQRKLRIGYGRSARLIEAMEEQGIVAPADGSRPREVLLDSIENLGTNIAPKTKPLTPPQPKKTDSEAVEEYIDNLEKDEEFLALLKRYDNWIKSFYDITERKVSILDEYGDEDWDALYKEISTLLLKIYKQELSEGRQVGYFDTEAYFNAGNTLNRLRAMFGWGGKPIANLGIYLEVKFKEHYKENSAKVGKRSAYMSFDSLTGRQFEGFVAKLLKELGYSDITGTPITGDQGADIVAKKNGKTLLVQAKRYYKPIGNSAVQEIVGAIKFYNGDEGWVITNSTFTPGAKSLAQKNSIRLIDGQELSTLLINTNQNKHNLVQG